MAFTFFFRDSHTLEQVIKYLLPIVDGMRKVKVWDAGCAMGPEPYTFAILLAERMGYFAYKNVEIHATDIDETNTFGNIITEAIYPEPELSRMPKEIFDKYFAPTDKPGMMKLDDRIRSRVSFTKNDLLQLSPISSDYSLIICKNVLLHLQPHERIEVIRMFHKSLAKDGLFTTEQTQSMPKECEHLFKKLANDANVYQKIG